MAEKLILEFLALSIYALFMGFCFCDFFKLHILRKLVWFVTFALVSIVILKTRNEFDLSLILPIPTLLAMGLGWLEKQKRQ